MKSPHGGPWKLLIPRIDGGIFILALFLAASFWLLNAFGKQYETKLSLPLHLEYENEGLIAVKLPPKELEVNLTGVGWDLIGRKNWFQQSRPLRLQLLQPTVTKSFSQADMLNVFYEQLRPLQLNYVTSPTLVIDIQERISKIVLLTVDTSRLVLAPNCRVYTPITLEVDNFTLTGAQKYVANHSKTYALQFDTAMRIDETFESVSLHVNLPYKTVLQAYPNKVTVSFLVGRFEKKEITVPIEPLNFPRKGAYRALLSDTTVTINYTVRSNQIAAVKPELFTIAADYKQRNRSRRTIQPQIIHAPPEALEIQIHPNVLKLRYVRHKR